jgi:hypothetical protein
MTCKVEGCREDVKYAGLCGKHYKRQWRHGNPLQTAYIYAETRINCKAPDCVKAAETKGYCKIHYTRVYKHGTPTKLNKRGELDLAERRQYNKEDRIKAEQALGRPLPAKAIVHHHEGNPSTLVICPDQAYHMLIHGRIRRLNDPLR